MRIETFVGCVPTALLASALCGLVVACSEPAGPGAAGAGAGSSGTGAGASVSGTTGGNGSQAGSSGGAGAGTGQAGAGGHGSGGAGGGPDLSAEIYDRTNLPRFDIELPPESVQALQRVSGPDDPLQDEYVSATLRYGTITVSNIGLRIKGEGSFRGLDEKAPFKLKFDEFVDDQTFLGLERMTLNNMVEDPSFLAERLAYDLFRHAGLPAPRCNSALVVVNGEFYGVYANVEAEDTTFLSRWFASNDGNLYEEGQVDFVPGAEAEFDLETNEAANDRTDLAALIAAVDTAKSATFLEDIGGSLDTDHFLRFTAAEAAVNQWDMYAYTVFYPNNFRIYNDPASGKFVFLPWGMDLSMKPFRDSGKPYIALFELARQGDFPNGAISTGLLFRRCLESPGCVTAYRGAVESIIEAYESADLEGLASSYYEQIREQVAADPRKEYSQREFERGFQSLLDTIRERPDALRADLAR
ncbi:CotH kinase family protein [Sorangium sp. So ce448]|uniref:CotH kinase family protein n=1 Tax=Sorangium sp. So ce448 TaxID=3133314 RepID=UPI003F629B93